MLRSDCRLEQHKFLPRESSVALLPSYEKLLGPEVIRDLEGYRKKLHGRKIIHVNSTFDGGGVAEILQREVQLSNELGVAMEWYKVHGDDDFFHVTKELHNALQGKSPADPHSLVERYQDFFQNGGGVLNKALIDYLRSAGAESIVVLHDPQPLFLINFINKSRALKLWRVHIDTTTPDSITISYITGQAVKCDGIISTMEHFMRPHVNGFRDLFILPPSIDPFSEKNSEMDRCEVVERVHQHGIRERTPLLVQVSRLDPWKDPVGVIRAFEKVRSLGRACQLALVYNSASDDPEGSEMERVVRSVRERSPYSADIFLVPGDDPRDVNAFQRYAGVVIQKSIREGFALTVTEALYKGSVVVATEVGGITLQVQDRVTGFTVKPYGVDEKGFPLCEREYQEHIAAVAQKCIEALELPELEKSLAEKGRERVVSKFLATAKLKSLYDIALSFDPN